MTWEVAVCRAPIHLSEVIFAHQNQDTGGDGLRPQERRRHRPGPPLSEEKLYPKEKALIDLVAAERMEGRRMLVYVTHTGTRDITGRMDDILTRHGFRVAVMKADAVAPNRREAWVADKVQQGIDVLICHPRLVQTGLDLIDFPTTVWDETNYSVCVVRQASRRSWRIGQTRPVKVVFMSYKNTLQADALKLVAKKLQSSLAVEGELPEDGLAAYGDDMMMALGACPRKTLFVIMLTTSEHIGKQCNANRTIAQCATGGSEILVAWLRERVGRVDSVGHSLQPAHPLASVVPRRLCRSTSRPKASLRFLNPNPPKEGVGAVS